MSVQAQTVVVALARLAVTQNRATSAAARVVGINPTAWAILAELSLDGWLTNGQIAERLSMSTGGVTPALTRLETLGLLERRPHPGDGRSSIVAITAEGQAALDRASAAFAERLLPELTALADVERWAALRVLAAAGDAAATVAADLGAS